MSVGPRKQPPARGWFRENNVGVTFYHLGGCQTSGVNDGFDWRRFLALCLGKLTQGASRFLGRGGSSFPGRIILWVDPAFIRVMAGKMARGTLVVTGTNGKTTTAKLVASILGAKGWGVCRNGAGANLIGGLAAAFLNAANFWGKVRCQMALLEVDEATVPQATGELQPAAIAVTNFFRDQLDRYGELTNTVELVRRGLREAGPRTVLVLNADDPMVAGLGKGYPGPVLYYGVEEPTLGRREKERDAESPPCPNCGEQLAYTVTYYAHLGNYRCPACGWARPRPEVRLQRLRSEGSRGYALEMGTPQGTIRAKLPVPGFYNVYNALAATALVQICGVEPGLIVRGLEGFAASFGRMERLRVGGTQILLALVKNPVGFNQVLQAVLEDHGPKVILFLINDRYADGTDVSWLWDADLERLEGGAEFAGVIVGGLRAEDMAVRLKYAGWPPEAILMEHKPAQALERAIGLVPPGGIIYVLPTYTALLEIREVLQRRGWARPFWEES